MAGEGYEGLFYLCISVVHMLLQDLESCRLRLDPEMDRHRYERKISFAGVLDENEDSKDSLHSSSHTLKSDTGCEEKKGLSARKKSFHILRACYVALDFMSPFP